MSGTFFFPFSFGTLDTIHVETLQPPEWIALVGAQVGAKVPPPLDLGEMGLPADLLTEVVAIEPCPRLPAGDGRLVLTTVDHLNSDVWELTAVNSHGVAEHLRPTGLHKFYSETRRDWVSTKDIHDNEVIRGRAGPLTIVAKRSLPGTQRVYNLTVEGEHVYYVSELGLLAHNNCGTANRRDCLNAKFGRTGNLNADINARGIDNAIRVNAELATDYARLDRNLGRISTTPQAVGTQAHKYFERLNNRISNRVAGTYRVSTEEFRSAADWVVALRTAGSIRTDVLYTPWTGRASPTIFDLKTYTLTPRSISAARQDQFLDRYRANAQEIYVRQ